MNAQKEYFIYLLSCFLSGETPQGRECDFTELFRLADIHDVGAILASELKLVEPPYRPQGEIASHFTQTIGLTLRGDHKRQCAFAYITEFLNKLKIERIFVKGIILKDYYPEPALRTSGDIDIIVRPEAFDVILSSLGEDTHIELMDRSTHLLLLNVGDTEIEIHDNADIGIPYFDDIFSLCERTDSCTFRLKETDHLLYVIAHLAKHLAYRGAGIRMLMDIDVMVRRMRQLDEAAFLKTCAEAGIGKTAHTLLSLCAYWLHTPLAEPLEIEDTLLLAFERVLIDGGSFGYEENAVPLEYYSDGSRTRALLKMAFPGRDYLKECYPYYHKHAYLYPVAVVNRLLDGLFKRRKQARQAYAQLKDKKGSTAAQLEIVKELEIRFQKGE